MRDFEDSNKTRAVFLVFLYKIYKQQCKRYGPGKTRIAPGFVGSSNDGVATFNEFVRFVIDRSDIEVDNPSAECVSHHHPDTLYPDLDWIVGNLEGDAAIEWPRHDEFGYGALEMRAAEVLVGIVQDLIQELIKKLEKKTYRDSDEDEERRSKDQASIRKWKERYNGNDEGVINSDL